MQVALLVTLIFCVLLKINRDDLEDELPGGMDMLGSALIFVNTSLPGAALVFGVLAYGLGTVIEAAEEAGIIMDNPLVKSDLGTE